MTNNEKRIKTDEDRAKVKRINTGIRKLSKDMYNKINRANFKSFTQYEKMFWDVTNRAWLSVEHSTFEDKLEFATLFWKDYEEKNLVRSKRESTNEHAPKP